MTAKMPQRSTPQSLTSPPPLGVSATLSCRPDHAGRQDHLSFGHWLSGFSDGEACFSLAIDKGKKTGRLRYTIKLRKDDSGILEIVRDYWKCGRICYSPARGSICPTVAYSVSCLEEIRHVVIPHFDRHPLRSKKSRDFLLWKTAAESNRQSLTFRCLMESMAETRKYNTPVRPFEFFLRDGFEDWLAGFTDGEGCLDLQYFYQRHYWTGMAAYRLKLRADDHLVLKAIQRSLCNNGSLGLCGKSDKHPRLQYVLSGASNLQTLLVPLFDKHPLRAKKRKDYVVWKEGVSLLCEVKSRPRVGKTDGKQGYVPKWKESEVRYFCHLCDKLKEIRRYKET